MLTKGTKIEGDQETRRTRMSGEREVEKLLKRCGERGRGVRKEWGKEILQIE